MAVYDKTTHPRDLGRKRANVKKARQDECPTQTYPRTPSLWSEPVPSET